MPIDSGKFADLRNRRDIAEAEFRARRHASAR